MIVEFYYFVDVFIEGYGIVLYLCFIDFNDNVYCILIMGKLRVVFFKIVRVLRLELIVVVLVVKVD